MVSILFMECQISHNFSRKIYVALLSSSFLRWMNRVISMPRAIIEHNRHPCFNVLLYFYGTQQRSNGYFIVGIALYVSIDWKGNKYIGWLRKTEMRTIIQSGGRNCFPFFLQCFISTLFTHYHILTYIWNCIFTTFL